MNPIGRLPKSKVIRTVSFVVIAAVGFTVTILLLQDHPDTKRQATEQGDARAKSTHGVKNATEEGVPKDAAEAARWYRKAAEQGDADAQNILGFMYAIGIGVAQDDAEAARWYRKAAEQGDARAQDNLGGRYSYGQGVPKDAAEAVRWYRKAAEQGHVPSQFRGPSSNGTKTWCFRVVPEGN